MFDLASVQQALRDFGLDGWLLYDFRGMNVLARRVLGLGGDHMLSRRWFYFIPAAGEPLKLVHRIESGALDAFPGKARVYLRWQELEAGVRDLLQGAKRVAMEYVPRNANPYVSRVDAGTVELVRSYGVEVLPSGDLIQLFEACWDDEQWAMHLEASRHTRSAYDAATTFLVERVKKHGSVRETEVQQRIMEHFAAHKLVTDHPPIVAVNAHSADPHFAPGPGNDDPIKEGDFVLIDLWAKLDRPRAVFSDLTRTYFVGKQVPARHQEIFRIVAQARDAAIQPRARRLRAPGAAARLAGRSGGARGDRQGRARRRLLPSDRALDRAGDARQRRQHGQSGDARDAPGVAANVLLGRAGDLPAREVRRAERGGCLCGWE